MNSVRKQTARRKINYYNSLFVGAIRTANNNHDEFRKIRISNVKDILNGDIEGSMHCRHNVFKEKVTLIRPDAEPLQFFKCVASSSSDDIYQDKM